MQTVKNCPRTRKSEAVRSRTSWLRLILLLVLLLRGVSPLAAQEVADPRGIISRIHREPVESRAIAAIGYSKRLRALEIEFRRGGTYRYLKVPQSLYRDLMTAESKARFYNRNVRGKYDSVYVRPSRKK